MNNNNKHISRIDNSVNFVTSTTNGVGIFESRYVRRNNEYFICYLSSQAGCALGCKMCSLTDTGQIDGQQASVEDFIWQAKNVLHHHNLVSPTINRMHFNFMARGEPLTNPIVLRHWNNLSLELTRLAEEFGIVQVKFNISTIFPKSCTFPSTSISSRLLQKRNRIPEIYYSLYSTKQSFRDKWLPNAAPLNQALNDIGEYIKNNGAATIHYPFIAGQNDTIEDCENVRDLLLDFGMPFKLNIIRYNPPNGESAESSEEVIERNIKILTPAFSRGVYLIPRVGYDVKASCGMFLADNG